MNADIANIEKSVAKRNEPSNIEDRAERQFYLDDLAYFFFTADIDTVRIAYKSFKLIQENRDEFVFMTKFVGKQEVGG